MKYEGRFMAWPGFRLVGLIFMQENLQFFILDAVKL